MQILALDSATNVASVAVLNSQKILAEFNLNTRKTHSERLMPMVSQVLDYAELTLEAIDGFVISIGPGSFTGLRIGLATMKSLAFFTEKPLVGVTTLDGLAANCKGTEALICPVLQARKNELYSALYINGIGGQERISDYLAISPEKLIASLSQFNAEKIIFLGDGTGMLPENLEELLQADCLIASELQRLPRAAAVGFLGLKKLEQGFSDDISRLTPLYIKASAAEERLKNKQKAEGGGRNGTTEKT